MGEEALSRSPGDQTLRYQLGYARLRFSQELAKQVSARAPEEAARAADELQSAIMDPDALPDGKARLTNSKAYRALAHALVDLQRYCGDDPASASRKSALRRRLSDFISRWNAEHPGDPYALYERESLKRWHDAT